MKESKATQAEDILEKTFDYLNQMLNESKEKEKSTEKAQRGGEKKSSAAAQTPDRSC
nr:hypothetical protein [uncultured Desulfobulbus sp.]